VTDLQPSAKWLCLTRFACLWSCHPILSRKPVILTMVDCVWQWFFSVSLGNCRYTILYGAKIACVHILSKTFPLFDATKYDEFKVSSNTQNKDRNCSYNAI